jgi:hypothetical protein
MLLLDIGTANEMIQRVLKSSKQHFLTLKKLCPDCLHRVVSKCARYASIMSCATEILPSLSWDRPFLNILQYPPQQCIGYCQLLFWVVTTTVHATYHTRDVESNMTVGFKCRFKATLYSYKSVSIQAQTTSSVCCQPEWRCSLGKRGQFTPSICRR